MSAPHPDAVATLGPEVLEWIAARRLADDLVPDHEKAPHPSWSAILNRAFEVGADGSLCWRVVVLTVPRQSTKSTLMAEVMAWRIHQAARFGERQIAVHTANRLQAAIRIQEDLHPWAETIGLKVSRRTGQERITCPDTSRWEITSLQAAYGSRPAMCFADESFDVDRALIEKAIIPAQARRRSPQTWLVSTANESCTDLMPHFMAEAQAGSTRTCLLWWGADPATQDLEDPATWAASNPAPTPEYLAEVERNRNSHDWAAQWLNVWPDASESDLRQLSAAAWGDARVDVLPSVVGPKVAAVEVSPDGSSWSVAVGWRDPAGRFAVTARTGLGGQAEAVAAVQDARHLVAGATVAKMIDWRRGPVAPYGRVETVPATRVLCDLVESGQLVHNCGDDIAAQVAGVQVRLSSAGATMAGRDAKADITGIKAVAWVLMHLQRADVNLTPPRPRVF